MGSKAQGHHQMGHDLAPLILQVVHILWETAASHRSPYAQQSQQKGNLSNLELNVASYGRETMSFQAFLHSVMPSAGKACHRDAEERQRMTNS